jgi:chorismate synthase
MRYTIFGESHGPAIGVVLEGVPAGVELDMDFIRSELARRAPGRTPASTARCEADEPEILSGVFEGRTTGSPLCAVIRNTDTHSADYEEIRHKPRPSHADYASFVKYGGSADYRGGGHFSGRLTAPLVFAGAVAKQFLARRGVTVHAEIASIGGVDAPSPEEAEKIIFAAKSELDSEGGTIRCTVDGVPAGLGGPDFGENIEGELARAVFAVPAVKGIEFGAGFELAKMRGSRANDPFRVENGRVVTAKNDSGGINGGISNGMPIVFTVAVRPTPSIGREQDTVDLRTMTEVKLTVKGRHDPCIVPRAVPVIEAAAAVAIVDIILRG